MIKTLNISNYALIDKLEICFAPGFNIITGETGAGKSIMLGALSLLLGGRADTKAIGDPQHKSVIEAEFDVTDYSGMDKFLKENDIDPVTEGQHSLCILRRELSPGGRSRAFINDTPVNLSVLRQAAMRLVDIHSQHQNLLLAESAYQLKIIDSMACNGELLEEYQNAYAIYRKKLKEFVNTREMLKASKESSELMDFQLAQLTSAKLEKDEESALEKERELLTNVGEIKENIVEALDQLLYRQGGVNSSLSDAISRCRNIAPNIPEAMEFAERLESAKIEIQDVAESLLAFDSSVQSDPERLQVIEDRLNKLYSLETAYRCSDANQLIEIRDQLLKQRNVIDNSENILESLEADARQAKKDAVLLAQKLTESRMKCGAFFAEELRKKATPLGMSNLQCEISITSGKLTPTGMDQVEFLFAFNKNQVLRPISGTASGGEISRLMLAIKAIVSERMSLPSIIFDEVDTGVSGDVANRMGEMMSLISQNLQVITITHLPQVAARGVKHFKVYKEDDEKSTHTRVRILDRSERISEIALMLSGDSENNSARQTAEVLLNNGLKN